MTGRRTISALAARFRRAEDGATLVEFGLALALLLLIFFGLIDFGRLAFHYVAAEKAVQTAARIAAVRPPACTGVPEINTRGPVPSGTLPSPYGTFCSAGVCADPGVVSCAATAGDPTSEEVWAAMNAGLPNDATMANIQFRYAFDQALGFLGGPYVPVVTVELQDVEFTFVTPLGQLAALAIGGANATTDALAGGADQRIDFPALSATVPGEDLALGSSG